MEIFRAFNPDIVEIIFSHLQVDPDYSKEEIAADIATRMVFRSDDTCVAVAFNETVIQGFCIAWNTERNHVWWEQAWNIGGRHVAQSMQNIIENFALERGKKEVRSETSRSAKAFERAYGYKQYKTILRKEL